ncbi:hypothetical protein VNO78_00218 [Psophocarpus tetragonolobus]|uniref:Uncharacterized protein n=1 Tax=Psophocarpus tetragonolobus TaxID=3891 RepID=A0AAN9SWU4_PSOTE
MHTPYSIFPSLFYFPISQGAALYLVFLLHCHVGFKLFGILGYLATVVTTTSIVGLIAGLPTLGEVVGTKSRGLSTDAIAGLPSVNYKTGSDQHGSNDSYVQIVLLRTLTIFLIYYDFYGHVLVFKAETDSTQSLDTILIATVSFLYVSSF